MFPTIWEIMQDCSYLVVCNEIIVIIQSMYEKEGYLSNRNSETILMTNI